MPQLLPLHSIEHVAEQLCNFQEEVKSHLDAICKCVMQPNPAPVTSMVSSASIVNLTSATRSQKQAVDPLERRSNLILYGVPEKKDISVVSDVLQVVAGSKIAIKDTFRLGKKPSPHQSSHTSNSMSDESTHRPPSPLPPRPRPILIKLSCPWDWRIILANKRKLSETEGMGKYFLQPDLSLDERKKHRDAYLARRSRGQESNATQNV